MEIAFHKNFKKELQKLPKDIQKKFADRLALFCKNPNAKILNNHSVDMAFTDSRSINVTGDYRAIFKEFDGDIYFITIGNHSKLYWK